MAKHGGFGGGMPGMNMNNLMKQYQKMQKKLEETQEELAKKEYLAQAGGGAVKVVLNGERKVLTRPFPTLKRNPIRKWASLPAEWG